MLNLEGIFVSVISPCRSDYSLDVDGFIVHVRRILDSHIHGMVIAGTNGEFALLSNDERRELYKVAVNESKGKKPVICNIGCESTWETIELAIYCNEIGVDAVMATPPYFVSPT